MRNSYNIVMRFNQSSASIIPQNNINKWSTLPLESYYLSYHVCCGNWDREILTFLPWYEQICSGFINTIYSFLEHCLKQFNHRRNVIFYILHHKFGYILDFTMKHENINFCLIWYRKCNIKSIKLQLFLFDLSMWIFCSYALLIFCDFEIVCIALLLLCLHSS